MACTPCYKALDDNDEKIADFQPRWEACLKAQGVPEEEFE